LEIILVKLSIREYDILIMIVEGLTNVQIAQRLGISKYTVRNHVTNIMKNNRSESRAEIAIRGILSEQISLDTVRAIYDKKPNITLDKYGKTW
jgi:DNA-binding CsgD family transcriptional regulator